MSEFRQITRGVSRRLAFAAVGFAAVGAVAAAGLAFATGALGHPAAKQCAAGLAADRPGAVCQQRGGPETASDSLALQAQLNAREGGAAPGAYSHALLQRATLSGVGGPWQPVGNAPECAGATSGVGPCPAGSSANGNYNSTGLLGYHALSGRISAFASDPANPNHMWASPVAGGVFETSNGGTSWTSIGDSLPTQMVGAMAYDAPLGELIVGTGDNSFGGDGVAGHGIFRSTNDGSSWSAPSTNIPDLTLSFRIFVSPADTTGNTVYAATSKGLFRSTDGGNTWANENLPTSPSGYTPNCAGNTTDARCFFANMVTDVVVKGTTTPSGNAGAVMAVVGWRAGQKPDPGTGCLQGSTPIACMQAPQNGIYISPDGTPGSFTFKTASGTPGNGFSPNNVVGRTALGIAHGAGQSSDAVYALVEDATKFNGCINAGDLDQACQNPTASAASQRTYVDGMYATYNFGTSWTKIMDWQQLQLPGAGSALFANTSVGYGPGVQAWYNLWVQPDPTASENDTVLGKVVPTRVAFGLEEVWENNQTLETAATNPLTTPYVPGTPQWVTIGRYWNACAGLNVSTPLYCNPTLAANSAGQFTGTTTHPDQHAAIFVPDAAGGGETLWIGSDGGAWKQHIAAGGDFNNNGWGEGLNVGINSQQAYDAEMSGDGTVVEGLQDNGEMLVQPTGAMSEIDGGDAFYNTIDPGNSANILEEYTYGSLAVSNDGGNSWTTVTPSGCGSSTTGLFATPLEQDPTAAGHVVAGCSTIYEDTTTYNTSSTWNADFTLPTLTSGATSYASAVAVRGSNIYVGFCGYCDTLTQGTPFANGVATNVGGTWHVAAAKCVPGCGTANGNLPSRYITSIQMDPTDPTGNTVYVTLANYARRWVAPGAFGDATGNVGNGHVYKSTDGGATFTDITGNLPDNPANWAVVANTHLFVATDIGVYVAPTTSGGSWSLAGTGLPNTPVFTLRVSPGNLNLLLAGTYGRGAWTLDITNLVVVTPEAPLAAILPLSSIAIVGGAVAWRRRRSRAPRQT